ncbi:hypothetical protein LTR53_000748 [Teratosphaeriaceae sp. CCFEE 6253]|nr:hypothetical protein LTR53_000748 [Teratosphaeriaceae sp. CCFEE 6253]
MIHLPEEIWLQIFTYVLPSDVWSSVRLVSKQFTLYAEDTMTRPQVIGRFTTAFRFTLGGGSHHRWYDVRPSMTFSFKEFNKHNPRYALFADCRIHPPGTYVKVMEHWKRLTANNGLGRRQEWRVQHGDEGEVRTVVLARLVVADGEGLWCDWRELFDAYYGLAVVAVKLDGVSDRHDGNGAG